MPRALRSATATARHELGYFAPSTQSGALAQKRVTRAPQAQRRAGNRAGVLASTVRMRGYARGDHTHREANRLRVLQAVGRRVDA